MVWRARGSSVARQTPSWSTGVGRCSALSSSKEEKKEVPGELEADKEADKERSRRHSVFDPLLSGLVPEAAAARLSARACLCRRLRR